MAIQQILGHLFSFVNVRPILANIISCWADRWVWINRVKSMDVVKIENIYFDYVQQLSGIIRLNPITAIQTPILPTSPKVSS